MNLENISHRGPFREEQGYIEKLVTQSTEKAINHRHHSSWHSSLTRIAASILIIIGVGYSGWMLQKHRQAEKAPLDTFLSNISDEEAELLENYYVGSIYEDTDDIY